MYKLTVSVLILCFIAAGDFAPQDGAQAVPGVLSRSTNPKEYLTAERLFDGVKDTLSGHEDNCVLKSMDQLKLSTDFIGTRYSFVGLFQCPDGSNRECEVSVSNNPQRKYTKLTRASCTTKNP